MTDAEIEALLKTKVAGTSHPYVPLNDRNALARVIGKMTEEEQDRLVVNLDLAWFEIDPHGQRVSMFLLTCDPRVIAECVAKAIQKGKA